MVWMKLGRVSNLPTVWTNVLTGLALASASGTQLHPYTVMFSLLAITFAYLAGMLLNDVFDVDFDKLHQQDRPIANGEVALKTVVFVALTLLVCSVSTTLIAAHIAGQSLGQACFSVLALIGCILLYNAWHKNNPLSPVIMGCCRALVYITCALIVSRELTQNVLIPALMLCLYVMGLTYTAKQEHLNQIKRAWPLLGLAVPLIWAGYMAVNDPLAATALFFLCASVAYALHRVFRRATGDIPVAVVTLIAGIALWDAVVLFASGFPALAMLAMVCWVLTLLLQRGVSGT